MFLMIVFKHGSVTDSLLKRLALYKLKVNLWLILLKGAVLF
jgi:hypothetical protein